MKGRFARDVVAVSRVPGWVDWGAEWGGFARVRVFSKKLLGRGGVSWGHKSAWRCGERRGWRGFAGGIVAVPPDDEAGRGDGMRGWKAGRVETPGHRVLGRATWGAVLGGSVRGGVSPIGPLARGEGEAGRFCGKHRVNKLRMKRKAADRNIPSTGCGDMGSIVHCMCTKGNRAGLWLVVRG